MAFRVYKPRNVVKVRAEQVKIELIEDLAERLMGRPVYDAQPDGTTAVPIALEIPTFDGVKRFEVGTWIIKDDDNSLTKMDDEEFQKTYEVARNTNGS